LLDRLARRLDPELYYGTKYSNVNRVFYEGRVLPSGAKLKLDVRNFFTNKAAAELMDIVNPMLSECDDQKAHYVDAWVQTNIKYVSDKRQFNLPEFWMFPFETLKTRRGDCDDGAILAGCLLVAAGVPAWKVRLTAGLTKSGEGHCWLTYYCVDSKRWVALDWCFNPSTKEIHERLDYKDAGLYGRVWFSWTALDAFFGEAKQWSAGGGFATYILKAGPVVVNVSEKV